MKPKKISAKEGWILYDLKCYQFAAVAKPVSAFEINTTYAGLGGKPAYVYTRDKRLSSVVNEAYDCVVYRTRTSCNSMTHAELTVDELRWFMSRHAGKVTSRLEPHNASHILDFILSEAFPVSEGTRSRYDSIEDMVPYCNCQGLHDILRLFFYPYPNSKFGASSEFGRADIRWQIRSYILGQKYFKLDVYSAEKP